MQTLTSAANDELELHELDLDELELDELELEELELDEQRLQRPNCGHAWPQRSYFVNLPGQKHITS